MTDLYHHINCASFDGPGNECDCGEAAFHHNSFDKPISFNTLVDIADLAASKAVSDNLDAILQSRAESYGDYAQKSVTVQAMKNLLRQTPNWNDMAPAFQESMDMICSKLGRLLHGDPEHKDGWLDIEGYARLARRMVE